MAEKNKSGQIWVETVIYTLIGLAIIGILLSILKPVIEDKQDQIIIENSLDILQYIDGEVEDLVSRSAGNSRLIEIKIKKGVFSINSQKDSMGFSMISNHKYSEVDQEVNMGKITALTKKKAENYEVFLKIDYSDYLNLTWDKTEIEKVFQPAPTPHNIIITNMGIQIGKAKTVTNIDFS